MICSSANWRTISTIACCSSVISRYADVSTAMGSCLVWIAWKVEDIGGRPSRGRAGSGDRPLEDRLRIDPGVDRLHRGARLEQDLLVLVLLVGLHHDRPADAQGRLLAVHDDGADDDVQVAAAAQAEVTDRPRVDPARLALERVDDLH